MTVVHDEQPIHSSGQLIPHWAVRAITDTTAGIAGGIACVYAGHPFDTVKVKLQTQPQLYQNGAFDCFRTTFRQSGFRGLYTGATPALLANVSENAVLFACYGSIQRFIRRTQGTPDDEELSLLQKASAGALSACATSFVLTPTELVKCQLQVLNQGKDGPKLSVIDVFKRIVKTDGILGLQRGLSGTFIRECPGNFAMFFGYEFARKMLTPEGKQLEDLHPASIAIAGAVSGITFWGTVYPIDLVKTHMQTSASSRSFLEVGTSIYKASGIKGLYSGVGPCLLRSLPANAALFATVELTTNFLS
eukprot:CFRG4716T1